MSFHVGLIKRYDYEVDIKDLVVMVYEYDIEKELLMFFF